MIKYDMMAVNKISTSIVDEKVSANIKQICTLYMFAANVDCKETIALNNSGLKDWIFTIKYS